MDGNDERCLYASASKGLQPTVNALQNDLESNVSSQSAMPARPGNVLEWATGM
jgi:hypothetical protein